MNKEQREQASLLAQQVKEANVNLMRLIIENNPPGDKGFSQIHSEICARYVTLLQKDKEAIALKDHEIHRVALKVVQLGFLQHAKLLASISAHFSANPKNKEQALIEAQNIFSGQDGMAIAEMQISIQNNNKKMDQDLWNFLDKVNKVITCLGT